MLWCDLAPAGVRYWPEWLLPAEQAAWWARLFGQTGWQQQSVRLFGRAINQPRLTAWYGDLAYHYSGLTLAATPWPADLMGLRDRVIGATGYPFNTVLLTLYRDGHDCIGWHSDDEPELGAAPVVATLSLGAERPLLLRQKRDHGRRHRLVLAPGSLLLLGPGMQQAWQHSLPRRPALSGARISLTFRHLLGQR